MRFLSIIFLSLLLLCNCGSKSGSKHSIEYDHLLTIVYDNHYEGGRIIKSISTECESYADNPAATQTMAIYEFDYEYDKDKLIAILKYKIEINGNRILQKSTNYTKGTEESIEWKGNDTLNYRMWEYDSNKKIIHLVKRVNLSAPSFDFVVADNFEEWSDYDAAGRQTKRITKDLSTGEMRTVKFFYNEELESNVMGTVCLNEEMIGDTILTRRYENGILTDIFKMCEKGKSKWELTLTPDRDLVMSKETFEEDGMTIIVSKLPEFQSTDSLYYRDNREIKSVSVSPDNKITTLIEYDRHGNISKEMRYTKFND